MPSVKDKIGQADLTNFDWTLMNAVNSQSQPIASLANIKNDVKLSFIQDNNIHFTVGCNNLGGTYSLNNNVLHVDNIRTTQMMCGDKSKAENLLKQTMQGNSQLIYNTGGAPFLKQTADNGVSLMWRGLPTPEAQYNQKGETMYLQISNTTTPCKSDTSKTCFLVRPLQYDDNGLKMLQGNWQVFEGDIRGYTHQNNQNQVIRVKRFIVDNGSGSPSENVYVFDTVIETSVAN